MDSRLDDMSVWSECSSSLHLPHKCESRDRYVNSNNRPDILVADSETGPNIELDAMEMAVFNSTAMLQCKCADKKTLDDRFWT